MGGGCPHHTVRVYDRFTSSAHPAVCVVLMWVAGTRQVKSAAAGWCVWRSAHHEREGVGARRKQQDDRGGGTALRATHRPHLLVEGGSGRSAATAWCQRPVIHWPWRYERWP
mmetsp:Transcript_31505/g.53907  ORF Transcript_31505/g.53907 Transcript_31505/m.53907 type:complete len:112 (+) Transcript_31505:63-398(+)